MHANIQKGVEAKTWTQIQAVKAISHTGVPAQVAGLVHEIAVEYVDAIVVSKNTRNKFVDRAAMDRGINLERRYSGSNRKMDIHLKVEGDYYQEKRAIMQDGGYWPEELEGDTQQPESGDYYAEVTENIAYQSKFFDQAFFLADVDRDRSEGTNAEVGLELLLRLLRLDHDVIGKIAVKYMRAQVAHYKTVSGADHGRVRGYEPQEVILGQPFSHLIAAQKWIIVPWRCWGEETLPAGTANLIGNFPPREERTLPVFARLFGFHNVEDRDENGKNILHHLFTSAKFLLVAAEIALTCFRICSPKLPGDYYAAMSHKVTGPTPHGFKPLHVLCSGSDIMMCQRDVIEVLLESNTVRLADFDANINDLVTVFSSQ